MASNNLQTHSSAPLPSEKQLKQTLKNTKVSKLLGCRLLATLIIM